MPNLSKNSERRLVYAILGLSVMLNFTLLLEWKGGSDGKLYTSKQSLCVDFVQSYLKTVQKTDAITDFGGKSWGAAIAIESDFYNMCLLDLNEDSLGGFKTTNIDRFLQKE